MIDDYMIRIRAMLFMIPGILIAISFHEFAHGYVSYKMGDPTPKLDGRLTLNPFRHLDIVGTLCLLFFQVGWAKPVRINTACYKNKKKGTILVSLAGPCMNFLLAFISMLVVGAIMKYGNFHYLVSYIGIGIAYYSALINVGLGVFNLIPFPPLDGSNVLGELIPGVNRFYNRIGAYRNLILIVLLVSGVLSRPLGVVNFMIEQGMWNAIIMIFGLGGMGSV